MLQCDNSHCWKYPTVPDIMDLAIRGKPTGFIIGPWTDNCRTHVNAKNVITPSNSINQIYVKFITCLPTKLNCLIPGVRGYFRSFESNETAELLLLSDKIHIESLGEL